MPERTEPTSGMWRPIRAGERLARVRRIAVVALLAAGLAAEQSSADSHHADRATAGRRLGSTTTMAREMEALQGEIARLRSQMDVIRQNATPAERRQQLNEHLSALRQTLTRMHAMELQMVDDIRRGRMASDSELGIRQQTLAQQTAMTLEMLEQAVDSTKALCP